MNPLIHVLSVLRVFGDTELRQDAKFTAILERELDYVKARTYDIVYPAFKARQLIPVSNEVDPGAETITYRQWDGYGIANIISNYADDIPLVDALAEEYTQRVYGMSLGYQYSIQDLRRSAMSGARLDQRRAAWTRRGIEQRIENMGAEGESSVGMTGIANNANVTLVSPVTGTWSTATGAQMAADMRFLENSIIAANKGTFEPTTLALDVTSYGLFSTTPISTTGDVNTTAMQSFLANSQSVTEVVRWNKLATADAAGTGPRAVMYAKTPEVLTLEIPQEYEQFPPQAQNLAFFVPAHARCAGVIWYYPIGGGYMDGL
jgi:hypothetical protein